MVEGNWSLNLIHPAQRIASLIVQRLGLVPPIAIEELVREHAEVQNDILPSGGDAVVMARRGRKPLVILDKTKSISRRRFTLAHELGHLLIPWHIGTMSCHTDEAGCFDDADYSEAEIEANRFASELLMPQSWLRQVLKESKGKGLRHALSEVKKAKVSTAAASIALIKILPPGYIFTIEEPDGFVSLSGSSPETLVKPPAKGTRLHADDYVRLSKQHATIERVHWWHFESVPKSDRPHDTRNASLILHDIMRSLQVREASASKFTQSINGIIGAANSASKVTSVEELIWILQQRFVGRPELRRVVLHEEFPVFLAKRAEEIMERGPAQPSVRSHRAKRK